MTLGTAETSSFGCLQSLIANGTHNDCWEKWFLFWGAGEKCECLNDIPFDVEILRKTKKGENVQNGVSYSAKSKSSTSFLERLIQFCERTNASAVHLFQGIAVKYQLGISSFPYLLHLLIEERSIESVDISR